MMNFSYRITNDVIRDEDSNPVQVYGIEAVDKQDHVLRNIPDIFTDRERTEKFVSICNDEELELIHIDDVVEDQLS